ncbi:PfkB family carbohydrate kinase [Rhodobacter sp. KR11]|uniref:PfkB family carbohydrate kinase n=1 Tax=Rhodobacter sp. KR11 TaxID=2974588 RepID=UPI002222EF2F|nr:PfkB family carbohydrate kinase [Rhodobacter sp. KR11]MCW1919012.1 PfkB family carbohydrate kinase [Rhodobacter sp. KR11]
MPAVLIAGSLHYDIMVEADHLPRRDETAVGSRWYPKFGGKGGNQAVAVAKAGVPSRMLGAVGADDFGPFLRAGLTTAGVDDRFVATVSTGSGMSVAIMDGAGDYAATIVSGANLMVQVPQDPALWDDIALVVLQNEMPEPANRAVAQAARARGIPVLLNAAPARTLSPDFAALVDILVVNAVEAEMMGGPHVCCLSSAAEAAEALAKDFETVVVTAGGQGLAAWTAQDHSFAFAAEKVKVVSTHGAGDAFIGALAAEVIRGAEFEAACRAASKAAAKHVSGG